MQGPATESEPAPTSVAPSARTFWVRYAVLATACVLVIGVYLYCAKPGLLEARAPQAEATYYNLLVQGFRAGQLNLKMDVPEGFTRLADPYDPTTNRQYRYAASYPLTDLSYYKGKLYLYFGITPALVLFWPYEALTGRYLFHKDAVVIFCAIGFLAAVCLVCAVHRRYFSEVSFGVVVAGMFALGLAAFTPIILPRCDVYEVSLSCGYTFMMLALVAIWRALHEPQHRGRWLAAASLACGLAIGARPDLLFASAILLVVVGCAWRERRPIWALLLAAAGPIVLIGLGLMLYNTLRFDNPLEFGLRYELSAYREDTQQHFGLHYLWFNFRIFFLGPAHWSGHFPFVEDITVPAAPTGYVETEHPFGVLTNIPLVWLALAAPLAWRCRFPEARATLFGFLAAVVLLFVTAALTLGLHNSGCVRYELEFVPALTLLAVIGILGLERALANRLVWRWAVRCGWGLLLIFSAAFNLFASLARQAEADARLGSFYSETGRMDEAIAHFHKVLRLKPDDASAHNNLGFALARQGRTDDAISQYREALRLNPDDMLPHLNLGNALLNKGQTAEAISQFQEVLRLKPDSAEAHNNLGLALLNQGRTDEAISQYLEAIRLKPDFANTYNPTLLNNLAWALATSPDASKRNGALAVQLAERACELTYYQQAIMVGTLAAAYAEAGRFDEAVATARRARDSALAIGQKEIAGNNERLMELYKSGRAFHEAAAGANQ